jgi:hypothetical protein
VDPDSYFEEVRDHLEEAGFKDEAPPPGSTLKARRRSIKLSRFGVVETVVAVSTVRSQPDSEQLRTFGGAVVESALAGKVRIPRGFGSGLVVYPVFVADAIPDELREFVASYAPKRWSILEFPVVVDLSSGDLVLFEKTPLWGAAYYRTTRREARVLLAPP